jgi:quercetin dioxygenase-like cupin family protein
MTRQDIKHVQKVWGSEDWICNNKKYCGKILNIMQGYQCSLHYHKLKDETFFVIKGLVLLELGKTNYMLQEGEAIRIKPGQKHRFRGIRDSTIVEFSTHHKDADSYRLEKSRKA